MAKKLAGLFKKFFHIYRERLYAISFGNEKAVISKIDITFEQITYENYTLVKRFRRNKYVNKFKKMLDLQDLGFYSCVKGKPVGYGWAKLENSKDDFYIIKNCYLCRFFVSPQYRGLNIYPCLIKEIMIHMNKKHGIKKFYIAVEHNNRASLNGIVKIGFEFLQENRIVRCCKVTFNKVQLN